MNLAKAYSSYRHLIQNQWRSPSQIQMLQAEKLRNLVRHAYETVPYYRVLFDKNGLKPETITSTDDLKLIPITRKADLQILPIDQLISTSFNGEALTAEHTSGSTGQPFSVHYDSDFVVLRNLLFLRALRATGYRFGQKMLLITDLKNKRAKLFPPRWHYTSLLNSQQQLCEDLNRLKPDILYGCKTPLKLLADHIEQTHINIHHPAKVISTAETLDPPTRRLLAEAFKAEIYDFYGLTEMGIVGWECKFHDGYHLSEDTTIVEYLPVKNLEGAFKLVMTNLHLKAMPLIRFETGDIIYPGSDRRCGCGCRFSRFQRVEGRLADVICLKDGQRLSPYRLTCALETVEGLKTYRVIQDSLDRFTVLYESGIPDHKAVEEGICSALHAELGNQIETIVRKAEQSLSRPGRKFRIVESRIQDGKIS